MSDSVSGGFREVNLSDGKCNVSLYVCAEEEKKIDEDPEYASELFRAALEGKLPSAGDNDSDIGGLSDNESNEIQEETKPKKRAAGEWNSAATWAFINSIKKNIDLLHMKLENRTELYKKAQEEIKEEGYEFTFDSIKKKFSSLLSTYTRTRLRARQTGNSTVQWEFYDTFDKLITEVERAKGLNDSFTKSEDLNGLEEKSQDSEEDLKDIKSHESSPVDESSATLSSKGPLAQDEPESPKKTDARVSRKRKRTEGKDSLKEENVNEKSASKLKVSNSARKKRKGTTIEENKETSVTENSADHIVISENDEGFNHSATLLFIDCIRKNKELLKTKQSAEMFSRIRKTMTNEGFPITEAKLRKKWYNLLVSYRRILERANETGDLVASWPYFEALDSIISDTKALALNNNLKTNGISNTWSSSRKSKDDSPKNTPSKVIDLVANAEICNNGEDDDFQRAFIREWEEREMRREERDIVKLNLLQKIAKSMEIMTRKQDALINVLKKNN